MYRKILISVIPIFLIFLINFLVYGKAIQFKYVFFDDNRLVIGSFNFIRDLSNIPNAFLEDVFHGLSSYFRPILTVSFILDAQFCGLKSNCYHFTNLLLHIIFCLILYLFFLRLEIDQFIATLLTLVFSVHPAIVSAIVWIPGRNDILMGIFFLVAFIFFDIWVKSGRTRWLFLHITFFNLAIYTKELSFLLLPLLYLYFTFVKNKYPFKRLLILGWIIFSGIWLLLRFNALEHANSISFAISLLTIIKGVLVYLGDIFFPHISVYPTFTDTNPLFGAISLLVLITWICISRLFTRKIFFSFLWFLVLIIPLCVNLGEEEPVYFQHRLYLPIIGFFIGAAWIIPFNKVGRNITLIITLILIVIFSVLASKYADYYRNVNSFWDRAIHDSPHSGYVFQGAGYIEQFVLNDPQKAAEDYEEAIKVDTTITFARPHLSIIYLNNNQYLDAEKILLEDLKIRKSNYTWLQLGRVYYTQGKLDAALQAWINAYKLGPKYIPVVINLAQVYADLKNYPLAKKYYYKALALGGMQSEDNMYLNRLKFLENY